MNHDSRIIPSAEILDLKRIKLKKRVSICCFVNSLEHVFYQEFKIRLNFRYERCPMIKMSDIKDNRTIKIHGVCPDVFRMRCFADFNPISEAGFYTLIQNI